jgi:MGT family glycosyltransferase
LIYVTFGSVLSGMEEALGVYRTAMDAFAEMPIRVLMTVGHRFDHERLGPVASNMHIERWVPQANVFAAADLVVCHGGSGTVNGALAAGLPLVVCPLFADQNRNADTIQRVGAGAVLRSRKAPAGGVASLDHEDVPALSDAIISALNTAKYRETAQRIASTIAVTPTLSETVQTLGAGIGR